MEKPHWTDSDIDLLQKYYQTRDRSYLETLFPGRSWKSLQHKASRLKIAHSPVIRQLWRQRIGKINYHDRVYLAGSVDGEGCITISIKRSKADPYRGGSCLTPLVSISNCSLLLMDWLNEHVAGCTLKTHSNDPVRKDSYTFQITRLLDVKSLLEQILPHLVVKRKQAELVLEFCNVHLKDKWSNYNPRLFEIAKEVRKLNKKGKMAE